MAVRFWSTAIAEDQHERVECLGVAAHKAIRGLGLDNRQGNWEEFGDDNLLPELDELR